MSKSLSILLIFSILASTLPDSYTISVFRLANLYEHYRHHHENQERNLFKFLTDHYALKHHEEDHHNHDKLPFHHHNELSNPVHQVPCLLPNPYDMVVIPKQEIATNLLNLQSQDCNSSPFSGDIWQPPKA